MPPAPRIASPTTNIPPQSGLLVTIDESHGEHHYHAESVVYIRVHSFVVRSKGSDKCIMTCIDHAA